MSVEAALRRGRAARQQLMRDTVTVTRVTGHEWWDPSVPADYTTSTLYTGPADVKPAAGAQPQIEPGEREITVRSYDVALPWSAVGVEFREEDLVTVTASADDRLVGRVLTVTGVEYGPRRTARHLAAEDRDRP